MLQKCKETLFIFLGGVWQVRICILDPKTVGELVKDYRELRLNRKETGTLL